MLGNFFLSFFLLGGSDDLVMLLADENLKLSLQALAHAR